MKRFGRQSKIDFDCLRIDETRDEMAAVSGRMRVLYTDDPALLDVATDHE